jgi:hypothetical protein
MQILAAGKTFNTESMRKALATFDTLWAEWEALKAKYACCPTLYQIHRARHSRRVLKPILDSYRKRVQSTPTPKQK